MNQLKRGNRKTRIGTVVSDKMDKTVVVEMVKKVRHPLYQKSVRRSKKYKAHDEKNSAKKGDRVLIKESRPFSKDKNWVLVEILDKQEK